MFSNNVTWRGEKFVANIFYHCKVGPGHSFEKSSTMTRKYLSAISGLISLALTIFWAVGITSAIEQYYWRPQHNLVSFIALLFIPTSLIIFLLSFSIPKVRDFLEAHYKKVLQLGCALMIIGTITYILIICVGSWLFDLTIETALLWLAIGVYWVGMLLIGELAGVRVFGMFRSPIREEEALQKASTPLPDNDPFGMEDFNAIGWIVAAGDHAQALKTARK